MANEMLCFGIILGAIAPDADAYSFGYKDWIANKGFHECPYPQASANALSWRIGWNGRALKKP